MNKPLPHLRFSTAGVIRFDTFTDLYTEPHFALTELYRRRKDVSLKKSVHSELNGFAKEIIKKFKRPRAVLFRQLATPTHEIIRFLKIAKKLSLEPLIFEYLGDKFVGAGNRYKHSLGKMPIYQYTGTDGRDIFHYKSICDFNKFTGKKISNVQCHNGESLTAFHHHLFRSITKLNPKTHCIDATDWFNSVGKKAGNYYEHFLRLFVRDAILFENYTVTRDEGPFVTESVLPAFLKIENLLGQRPLIVRLLPDTEELRLFWDSYPKKVGRLIGENQIPKK